MPTMTKNKKRDESKINPANTRPENLWGHIVELIPPGGRGIEADHTADKYAWDLFVLCGNPKDAKVGATFHPDTSDNGWFVCPDNITFDPAGRLWVATDGANDFDLPDGVYGVDTEGPARGLPKLLFTCPHAATSNIADHRGDAKSEQRQGNWPGCKERHMNGTVFRNANGLPDPGQFTTARDMGPELRRLDIGQARQLLRLLRQHETAEPVEVFAHRVGKPLGKLDQQRIAPPGVAARQRRRLVRHVVGHALSLSQEDFESEAIG